MKRSIGPSDPYLMAGAWALYIHTTCELVHFTPILTLFNPYIAPYLTPNITTYLAPYITIYVTPPSNTKYPLCIPSMPYIHIYTYIYELQATTGKGGIVDLAIPEARGSIWYMGEPHPPTCLDLPFSPPPEPTHLPTPLPLAAPS